MTRIDAVATGFAQTPEHRYPRGRRYIPESSRFGVDRGEVDVLTRVTGDHEECEKGKASLEDVD